MQIVKHSKALFYFELAIIRLNRIKKTFFDAYVAIDDLIC